MEEDSIYIITGFNKSYEGYGGYDQDKRGVRPVVTLQSNLKLSKDTDGAWKISK